MDNNIPPVEKSDRTQQYYQNKNDFQFLYDMQGYLRQHNTEAVGEMIKAWMNELAEKIETYKQGQIAKQ